MLHAIESNSFEVLRETFLINLKADRKQGRDCPENWFTTTDVVVPEEAISDVLKGYMADQDGICAGLNFQTMVQWLIRHGAPLIGKGEAGIELEFLIWQQFADVKFVSRFPRLQHVLDRRNDDERFQVAVKTAALFACYATYRPDWLRIWMNDVTLSKTDSLGQRREFDQLQQHPDYAWQKALFQKIAEVVKAGCSGADLRRLTQDGSILPKAGETVHLFMPFAIPPSAFPLLKMYAEGSVATGATLYLYVLNPSSAFWWEGVSGTVGLSDEPAVSYLYRNAGITRTLRRRLYEFLNENADSDPKFSALVGEDSIAGGRPQDVVLTLPHETERVFVDPGNATFLRRLQRSIAMPSEAAVKSPVSDGSVVFCRAPNLVRELENLMDWLQAAFREDSSLTTEDVLVVTPDIEKAAGTIDAVMWSLPAERRVDWSILRQTADVRDTAAWTDLWALLTSDFRRDDFESWLEHPAVRRRWFESDGDSDILEAWFDAAGFRRGLQSSENRVQSDVTLEMALERLTFTALAAEKSTGVWNDIAVVEGLKPGWTVQQHPELLARLTVLVDTLIMKRQQWEALRQAPDLKRTETFFLSLADDLLDGDSEGQEPRKLIERVIADVIPAAVRTVSVSASPDIELQSVMLHLKAPVRHRRPVGVTFAGMGDCRGLPYKIIAIVGLNGDSGFPRADSTEDFDLTASSQSSWAVSRVGDRNERAEDRNTFTDLVLSARSKLFISYSEGADSKHPMPPSSVVEDFFELIRCVTRIDMVQKDLTVSVPASPWSLANYDVSRPWRSTNAAFYQALIGRATDHADKKALDVTPFFFSKEGVVSVDDWVRYLCNPVREISRKLGVERQETSSEYFSRDPIPAVYGLCPASDPLAKTQRLKQTAGAIISETSPEEIAARGAQQPVNGALGYREAECREQTRRVAQALHLCCTKELKTVLPSEVLKTDCLLKTDCQHLKAVRFPKLALYVDPVNSRSDPFAVEVAYSKSHLQRLVLTHFLRNVLRMPYALRICRLYQKTDEELWLRSLDATQTSQYKPFVQKLLAIYYEAADRADVLWEKGATPWEDALDQVLRKLSDATEKDEEKRTKAVDKAIKEALESGLPWKAREDEEMR